MLNMLINYRQPLISVFLTMALAAGVLYDTRFAISLAALRALLGASVVACLGAVFVVARYPQRTIMPSILSAWPMHLFTICFVGVTWCFHSGAHLGSVIAYTIVGYATYLLVPLCLLLDRRLFDVFIRIVAVGSAILAIPSYVGAMGIDSVAGVSLSNKYSYSSFSGIIASGGVFEHAEGHAMQMAVGLFCCIYCYRRTGKLADVVCVLMVALGLLVSQGRGAIFGVVIAVAFGFLPDLVLRSRGLFLGSLAFCLLFPFLIWPQLANIPGVASYLRMERGLSGRDVAWLFAISLIEEKPWTGHGFESSGELSEQSRKQLRKSGYSGAGTTFHNTFITKTVELGGIASVVYALLYVVALARICGYSSSVDQQRLIRNVVIVVLTASIFRDYNVGGVRSTAMLAGIFLGLASLWPLADFLRQASQEMSDDFLKTKSVDVPTNAGRGGSFAHLYRQSGS
ncbi:MAG: O-antigen ligase family protein [Planctomycetales bacterium]|nr:O-antigen ligase family protein [Planctomycetales bacterium]